MACGIESARDSIKKFFCFFFSKKEVLAFLPAAAPAGFCMIVQAALVHAPARGKQGEAVAWSGIWLVARSI
jgi:hypothetical protein